MTNYTKEQREMIAEFIEKEILPMRSMVNQSLVFSKQDEWVNVKDINEKLKNLKFIRFAEIKNQVGTRFLRQFYDDKYIIAHNQTTNENIIININKSLAFSVNAISDDTLVEVINETSSNNVGDR
ncbi:hypothetical protein J3U18_09800 [Gilliamella sp. B3482]|uniref:hypothetical protein n=1 Tax=Gilliamella sp. B3482 TaxID=2817991 RepID=UPI002269C068|nr:hypothetical protein [Gilliamella sp. B3482]MCX8581987.1 hypothetical protein [Gilliamella sp. B3482]